MDQYLYRCYTYLIKLEEPWLLIREDSQLLRVTTKAEKGVTEISYFDVTQEERLTLQKRIKQLAMHYLASLIPFKIKMRTILVIHPEQTL